MQRNATEGWRGGATWWKQARNGDCELGPAARMPDAITRIIPPGYTDSPAHEPYNPEGQEEEGAEPEPGRRILHRLARGPAADETGLDRADPLKAPRPAHFSSAKNGMHVSMSLSPKELCQWARQVWARHGKIIVIADGSYKERAQLKHLGIVWTSTAGCGWVVGAIDTDDGWGCTTAASVDEGALVADGWPAVGYANVHAATAGERALSNYEAEQYGMVGFLRWWTTMPWGNEERNNAEVQFWSDCATIVDLIMAGECRPEAKWRRTAASPAWTEIRKRLIGWPLLSAHWIRGHADRNAAAGAELTLIQKGNIAADKLADYGRDATGTLRTNCRFHMFSGAIMWTMGKTANQLECTVEGNLTKAWKQRAGRIHMERYMTPTRLQRAGRLDVRKWDKPSLKDHHVNTFRCKLWGEQLSSLDVYLRNKAGKGALQDLALCTLCNEKVLGDAWHTIGLCSHPELQEARALAAVALRATIRAIKLPGLRRHICNSLNTAADGAWVCDHVGLQPNPWLGELPDSWVLAAGRELGMPEPGAEEHKDTNTPTRELHALDVQLRQVSKMAVLGARAIWWKAAQLWGALEKGRGLAASRGALKDANAFFYKHFAEELRVYKNQWAVAQAEGGNRWARTRWSAQKWLEWGREAQYRQLTLGPDGRQLRASTIMEAFSRQRMAQQGVIVLHSVPAPAQRPQRARVRPREAEKQTRGATRQESNAGKPRSRQRPPPPPRPRRRRRPATGRSKGGTWQPTSGGGDSTLARMPTSHPDAIAEEGRTRTRPQRTAGDEGKEEEVIINAIGIG